MAHFTFTERKMLAEKLRKTPYREISKIINKSISSISDEVNKNGGRFNYNPHKAEKRYRTLKYERKKRRKLEISPGLRQYVVKHLQQDWSPEQIASTLNKLASKTVLSHETIYQFIYSDIGKDLKLWKHLRHRKKPQRVSHASRRTQKSKLKIPDRVPITFRPESAQKRLEFGHFEVDLMIFSHTKKVLAVFVDRFSRKTWAYINPNKSASAMLSTIREFSCDVGIANLKSLSFDNGSENFYHHIARDEFGTFETFFCDPYASWQKGTVENTNKLLRQYLPRSIDPSLLTHEYLDFVLHRLNNRPRKCLLFKTPNFCSV